MVEAAKHLLDTGGESAVTLRAVGHACGVSHNAPYKHFENRDGLLAAVAIDDFRRISDAFKDIGTSSQKPTAKLMATLGLGVDFSRAHPARYDLLFNNPAIAAQEGDLKQAAFGAFLEFVAIIEECQAAGDLPAVSSRTLAGLLFSTMQGLISAEASGRMHAEKGLTGVMPGLELLVRLLAPNTRDV